MRSARDQSRSGEEPNGSAPAEGALEPSLPAANGAPAPPQEGGWLARQVEAALDRYFAELEGLEAHELYQLVLDEIERPLLRVVMCRVAHNQSRAADMLGLSRGTLRKKLKRHGLL